VKNVKAKKHFGQHFLSDKNIANRIVESLSVNEVDLVVEVGPGMGILTEILLNKNINCSFVEIDKESVEYLCNKFPLIKDKILFDDFLKLDLEKHFKGKIALIGNFPYNISSQILFKMLDSKDKVVELVGMFQKEVADRVVSNPGSRVYGIISVFIQAFYNAEKLFNLGPEFFSPPPKVDSTIIRLVRNSINKLDCDEKLFTKIVKHTFNQRRKMIRNGLKSIDNIDGFDSDYLTLRPEQLSVNDFVKLTNQLDEFLTNP
jgi:16S rRNA (adenine1518-N6/adenine1519-N6)-dimethyltransferase